MPGNDRYTKVLLHLNGTDGATTFPDENYGGSSHVWTAANNAQIDTAEFKFGGASLLVSSDSGLSGRITTPDSADFTFGSGDFTVDFWFNCIADAALQRWVTGQSSIGGGSRSFLIRRTSSGVFEATIMDNSSAIVITLTGTTIFLSTTNTGWHHCALVRASSIFRLFSDGVQEASGASTATVNDSTGALWIGGPAVNGIEWVGWIDEYRMSVDIARWPTSASFVPPQQQYDSALGFENSAYEERFITAKSYMREF